MSPRTTKATFSVSQVRSVHALLLRKFKETGRGTIARIEKKLGLNSGYFAYHRNIGTLDVGVLFDALHLMGIDPVAFFAEAVKEAKQIEEIVGDDPPKPILKVMDATAAAAEDFDDDDSGAGAVQQPGVSAAAETSSGPEMISREWLEEIDELRYEKPAKALELLLEVRVTVELAPEYLGVCGSVYRLLIQLGHAQRCIRLGLALARQTGVSTVEADLLQRLSYVWFADGYYRNALEIAERATGIYDRVGQMSGVGKSMCDQALFLRALEKPSEAVATSLRALEFVDRIPRHKAAALHLLGCCYRESGNLEKALKYLRGADSITGMGAAVSGKITWLRAAIEIDLGRLGEAERCLTLAVASLQKVDLADFALASVHLVWVQLLRGRRDKAWTTALSTRFLVMELSHNKVVASAIAELIRGGQAALNAALAEKIAREIQATRRRTPLVFPSKGSRCARDKATGLDPWTRLNGSPKRPER